MPSFRRQAVPRPSPPPQQWRPQQFGRRGFRAIADPLIEPLWGGVRVLARLDAGRVALADEDGIDCTAEFAALAQAIAAAAQADALVLDGYLTVEATQESAGVSLPRVEVPSAGQTLGQLFIGSHHRPGEGATAQPPRDPNRPIAFVAVDLLSVDGTSLLDIPLLERKRQLEGVLSQGELIRVTPFVRPPAGTFLATWQASGLRRLAYKAANSRYLPGDRNEDWASVSMPETRR
jgi:bifunctional non-homologous end joining protein LigD